MRIGEAAAAAGVTPETLESVSVRAAVTLSRRNRAEAPPAAGGPAQICSFP